MPEPTLDDYIYWLGHDPDPEVRRNAAWVLGRQRDPRIAQPLIAAASDPDADVRLRVVEALGTLKHGEPVAALVNALSDAEASVRAQAARSLGQAGATQAIQPLLAALGDADPAVRAQVAEALGVLQAAAAMDALLAALLDDEDSSVRYFAAQSLARIGGPGVVAGIRAALVDRRDQPGVVIDLLEVLVRMQAADAQDAIAPFQQHADDDVRTVADWALGVLKKV